MPIYLTEYRSCIDFEQYAGEKIEAKSFEEAQNIAETLYVEVIGELVEEINV